MTMRPTVPTRRLRSLGTLTDRQLNRLLVGVGVAFVLLVVGFAGFYLLDRGVTNGPDLAERRIPQLEEAVRSQPNAIDLRLQLAGAYGAAHRYDDAIGQLTAVLAASPDDKTALVTRGDFLLVQGKLDPAAADYRHVIAIAKDGEFANVDTQLHQAYFSLGSILLKQDKASDAVPILQSALRINQTDADTLNLLGLAFIESGDPRSAVQPLRNAVLFVPVDWAEPYTNLARAYRALGQADSASWADAMATFAAGDAATAKATLAALVNGAAATDAYVGLGLVNERLGDRDAAIQAYGQALHLDPVNFAAQTGLSRLTGAPIGSAPPSSTPSSSTDGVPNA
jgi:tetratricopeptide (TPR) repeat protein